MADAFFLFLSPVFLKTTISTKDSPLTGVPHICVVALKKAVKVEIKNRRGESVGCILVCVTCTPSHVLPPLSVCSFIVSVHLFYRYTVQSFWYNFPQACYGTICICPSVFLGLAPSAYAQVCFLDWHQARSMGLSSQ